MQKLNASSEPMQIAIKMSSTAIDSRMYYPGAFIEVKEVNNIRKLTPPQMKTIYAHRATREQIAKKLVKATEVRSSLAVSVS